MIAGGDQSGGADQRVEVGFEVAVVIKAVVPITGVLVVVERRCSHRQFAGVSMSSCRSLPCSSLRASLSQLSEPPSG